MEIRQLEYFCAIVEAGTISCAAKLLHMTQPPLSYQMKMLEEELQVSLFMRGTKKIQLTEAGKTLYEQAGKILVLTDLTKKEVIRSGHAATLHIGLTPSSVAAMSEHLYRFVAAHPQLHLDIHEGSTFALKEQLESHQIDLTVLRTPVALNGCETRSLSKSKEELLPMAVPGYPLFEGRSFITLQDLQDQPLILAHRYHNYMTTAFEQAGLSCDIFCSCEDARTAVTLAEKGLGIAILPSSMLTDSSKLVACPIRGTDLSTEMLLAWRKGPLPVEVQQFLQMMETC